MTKWIKGKWHAYLEKYYMQRMSRARMLAEYNLHRHEEAISMYQFKKEYRINNPNEKGFFIADENADVYAIGYNTNWELYIKYKHKLESLNSPYI